MAFAQFFGSREIAEHDVNLAFADDNALDQSFRNLPLVVSRQITVRFNEANAMPKGDVLDDQVAQKRGLADNVEVLALVNRR